VPFFPPTDPQGMTKLERMGVVATGPCSARADDHAWNRPMPKVTTPTGNNSAAR
jgi:hypothetical protein